MIKINIMLIGLGPHAKRIYLRGLRKRKVLPAVIVDLQSQKRAIDAYLVQQKITAKTYFISDEDKDEETLSVQTCADLDVLLKTCDITHAIVSTEPKAHYAYLQYLITRGILTLTDKPITSPNNVCNNKESALLIQRQYQHLMHLVEEYKTPVVVQCQRRYDKRYLWIKSLVSDLMKKYELPINHIQIYHSDGSFYTPEEMLKRDNHPYKYGYGKLFHSGYHFIDLLSMMMSLESLPSNKQPTSFRLLSSHYSPADQLFAMDEDFYKKIFPDKGYVEEFQRLQNGDFNHFGEIDCTSVIEFMHEKKILTTCSLNLLSSGFSRRGWSQQSLDTYKNNGRVRHESITLNMGPLLSIQVHSYQSCEVKDRNNPHYNHDDIGGLDHFQVHIFRNVDLIGGKPIEVIEGKDLFGDEIINDPHFMGYNEAAREECLDRFLKGDPSVSLLGDQQLTIDLVTALYLSMVKRRQGELPMVECSLMAHFDKELSFQ